MGYFGFLLVHLYRHKVMEPVVEPLSNATIMEPTAHLHLSYPGLWSPVTNQLHKQKGIKDVSMALAGSIIRVLYVKFPKN